MFGTGNLIKQFLLSNSNINAQLGNKIYNVVVVDIGTINPPYLVIEVNSITSNYTKDITVWNDIEFSVVLLAKKYNDLISLSELVKSAIEFKTIQNEKISIDGIEFTDYNEAFDTSVELYTARLSFSCRGINK